MKPPTRWQVGDRLTHRQNPGLGTGRVVAVDGRSLEVEFPDAREVLRFAAATDALEPLPLAPGVRARLGSALDGEAVQLAAREGGLWRLADGRRVPPDDLWPLPAAESPLVRLAKGKSDGVEDFVNRLDGLRLQRLRQADGLGSFLGGRIRLFPHQLYAAERACATDPVRWLLADEVGLGKTVEACLILNRLLHTGRAERTLIVVPGTLAIQWLGELWRKYHQAFVLLDDKRLADVAQEHGPGFNPFDVYRRTVVSFETLVGKGLTGQALAAGIDLLVVDEAHHLKRPPRHAGNELWRAVAPLAALGRNVLLLTATPLEEDAHGFFRLLQLLRPEEFPEDESFADRLASRRPLPPCTSATRRADIGGLPPRVPAPVDLDAGAWSPLLQLEERIRSLPAEGPVARRQKAELVARALASPAALLPLLARSDAESNSLVAAADAQDPRLHWLIAAARRAREAREKVLVFVAHRETLERLKAELERQATGRIGLFHEDLPAERRDIEVAQFRLPEGPAVLISTEAGGEGRNFEFCDRLVLYDLPWNPVAVEQRIGRLDRIGRRSPTEIVYFRPPAGLGRRVAEVYEELGVFRRPLSGLDRELQQVAAALEREAVATGEARESLAGLLAATREAHTRVQEAALHELHRDPYRAEMAAGILARVPAELDTVTRDVVVRATSRFGFEVEEQSGTDTWMIEFGYEALLDQLPGVPPGSRYLGTFDREEAVANEALDYFASGHPLVEGVLLELEEGPRGQAALFQAAAAEGEEAVFGLFALYRRNGGFEAVAVDRQGPRPDLAARLLAPATRLEPVEARKWTAQAGWAPTLRKLAAALPEGEAPQAVAAFRLRPAASGRRAGDEPG